MFLLIYLYVYLSACLSVCLAVYVYVYVYMYMSRYDSMYAPCPYIWGWGHRHRKLMRTMQSSWRSLWSHFLMSSMFLQTPQCVVLSVLLPLTSCSCFRNLGTRKHLGTWKNQLMILQRRSKDCLLRPELGKSLHPWGALFLRVALSFEGALRLPLPHPPSWPRLDLQLLMHPPLPSKLNLMLHPPHAQIPRRWMLKWTAVHTAQHTRVWHDAWKNLTQPSSRM